MAQASRQEQGSVDRSEQERTFRAEVWGLVLLTGALCLFLALVSFSRVSSGHAGGAINLIGPVGAQVADVLLEAMGLGAFFLNAVLFFCGFAMLFGKPLKLTAQEGIGYGLAVPSGAVFMHLAFDGERLLGHKAGGIIGELGAEIGKSLMGAVGTTILTIATLLLAATLISETNPSDLAIYLGRLIGRGCRAAATRIWTGLARAITWAAGRVRWLRLQRLPWIGRWRRTPADEEDRREPDLGLSADEDAEAPSQPDDDGAAATSVVRHPSAPASRPDARPKPKSVRRITPPKPMEAPDPDQLKLQLQGRDARGFILPSTSLLQAPKAGQTTVDTDWLERCAEQLETSLLEFKVKGKVTGITPGPVVTMFEFEPAPGVKLSTISNLANDLARVIRAQSVRIVAPIPGKGVVGLEVPNESRSTVFLREILEHKHFGKTRAKLPLAIGKDIAGEPVVTDLAKMPHLLVAGATGSGKSVAINAMIASLLYHAPPEDVRLIMVDPKMLELSIYEGIPHLLVPVVTDPNQAATALKWAVNEMQRRYHLLKEMKVRNIGGYNRAIDRLLATGEGEVPPSLPVDDDGEPLITRLPYIVIVIDEFADLMMVASKDVEICVARLAQKARAAGVHLILATQRPSVDVITGLIKANFPTRISFRVFSRVDSRTVLDTQGAEHLLGMGDMLFRPPGRGDLTRVHGAYVDENELIQVVEQLKAQGEPKYQDEILVGDEATLEDIGEEEVDEMYDLAVELVTRERKASISMVQRKLRVGYNRAARMIEMMEREGIVGSSDGRGARDVLAPPPPP